MLHYLIELAIWLVAAFLAGGLLYTLYHNLFRNKAVAPTPVETPAVPLVDIPRPVAAPIPVAAPVTAVEPVRMARMERPRGLAIARNGKPDDFLRISGVGPKNEKILHSLGYFHFDQIAAWTAENVSWVDDHLKFNGRIDREEWINQCRLLSEGNDAEFTKLYGTGGEGAKDAGLRTERGPQNKAEAASPVAALMSAKTIADDEKAAASGKMAKPKGIANARGGKPDNLQRISGIGPKNESILHSLGFFHFDQIAAWTATEVNWVDDHLKFNGRIKREEWIRQSRLLFEGKDAEFTKLYGTGGLRSKRGDTQPGSRTRKP